jgi:hypothetical protein
VQDDADGEEQTELERPVAEEVEGAPPETTSAIPTAAIPTCATLEQARSRLRWVCVTARSPPSKAVTVAAVSRTGRRSAASPSPGTTVDCTRAKPYRPAGTVTAPNRPACGALATVWASRWPKWNGTSPALTASPATSSAMPSTAAIVTSVAASRSPASARFGVPTAP